MILHSYHYHCYYVFIFCVILHSVIWMLFSVCTTNMMVCCFVWSYYIVLFLFPILNNAGVDQVKQQTAWLVASQGWTKIGGPSFATYCSTPFIVCFITLYYAKYNDIVFFCFITRTFSPLFFFPFVHFIHQFFLGGEDYVGVGVFMLFFI